MDRKKEFIYAYLKQEEANQIILLNYLRHVYEALRGRDFHILMVVEFCEWTWDFLSFLICSFLREEEKQQQQNWDKIDFCIFEDEFKFVVAAATSLFVQENINSLFLIVVSFFSWIIISSSLNTKSNYKE